VSAVRAVHIISELSVGGVVTVVTDLLPALQERGIDAALWHFGTGGSARGNGAPAGYEIVDLGARRHGFQRRVHDLLARLRESDVDIIHLHDLSADVLAAAVLCGRRVFAHIHEAPPRELHHAPAFTKLGILRRAIRPISLRRFDSVVTCSQAAEQFARRAYGLPADQMRVVRNGVDVGRIDRGASGLGEPPDTDGAVTRFGYLGRIDSVKNVPLLLSTCTRLQDEPFDWSLTVMGDGPLRPALEERVDAEGLSDRISFVGEVANPIPHLRQIDVLVHPSDSEGMSISVLEAMALGVSVIAARVGGNSECIVHGHTGLLVPPGDEGAFTDACRALGSDRQLRERMGRRGRARVLAEFTIERVAAELARCYAGIPCESVAP
jgi:glycosyltransferase involved in cell wall biosynthesis